MNVTLKLPDDLCREARHRAVDASQSLSAWVADLMARELRPDYGTQPAAVTLLDALGDELLDDGELDLPDRKSQPHRPVQFP